MESFKKCTNLNCYSYWILFKKLSNKLQDYPNRPLAWGGEWIDSFSRISIHTLLHATDRERGKWYKGWITLEWMNKERIEKDI
jgi:hypothetical protein